MNTHVRGMLLGLFVLGISVLVNQASTVFAGSEPPDDSCWGETITIYAQGGVTKGTSGSDVIFGSAGDDVIDGRGGNDIICDFAGTNVIHGGSGNDTLYASGELYGDSGNDWLAADVGTTVMDGGSGNDVITNEDSGSNLTIARGGSGNDYLALVSAEEVYGDAGSDTIFLDTSDLLDCGSGNDTYGAFNVTTVQRCERNDQT